VQVIAPSQFADQDVISLIKDKFYADSACLVIRSENDPVDKRNTDAIKPLLQYFDIKRLKEQPAGIRNLQPQPSLEGYGIIIAVASDFNPERDIVYSKKFLKEYNRKRFNVLDKKGIPDFVKGGERKWYTSDYNEGVTGWPVSSVGNVDSNERDLSYSDRYGRVVLSPGEARRANYGQVLEQTLRNELLSEIQEVLSTRTKETASLKEIYQKIEGKE
jgi:hypothetical protein